MRKKNTVRWMRSNEGWNEVREREGKMLDEASECVGHAPNGYLPQMTVMLSGVGAAGTWARSVRTVRSAVDMPSPATALCATAAVTAFGTEMLIW